MVDLGLIGHSIDCHLTASVAAPLRLDLLAYGGVDRLRFARGACLVMGTALAGRFHHRCGSARRADPPLHEALSLLRATGGSSARCCQVEGRITIAVRRSRRRSWRPAFLVLDPTAAPLLPPAASPHFAGTARRMALRLASGSRTPEHRRGQRLRPPARCAAAGTLRTRPSFPTSRSIGASPALSPGPGTPLRLRGDRLPPVRRGHAGGARKVSDLPTCFQPRRRVQGWAYGFRQETRLHQRRALADYMIGFDTPAKLRKTDASIPGDWRRTYAERFSATADETWQGAATPIGRTVAISAPPPGNVASS